MFFFIFNSCSLDFVLKLKGQCCGYKSASSQKVKSKKKTQKRQKNEEVSINYIPVEYVQVETSCQYPNYQTDNVKTCNNNVQLGCLEKRSYDVQKSSNMDNIDANLNHLKFSGFPKTVYTEDILNLNGDLAPPIGSPIEEYHRKDFYK